MIYYRKSYKSPKCAECDCDIEINVLQYSKSNFGVALCRSCQSKIKSLKNKPTPEAINLHAALKKRGVPAELEKFDGYKTIDIAITDAMVNIEVDGIHHNFTPSQAMTDLYRTFYSFKKGYLTLRIPNSLIKYNLEETADLITEFLSESKYQLDDDY